MSKAKERALDVYPRSEKYTSSQRLIINDLRDGFIDGYKLAEKDMKERFIQFVHRHYPINYTGWIQDFQKAMEDEK